MDLLSRPGRRRRRWKPGVVPQSSDAAPLQRHCLVLFLLLVLVCYAGLSRAAIPPSSPSPNKTIPQQHDTQSEQLAANPAQFRPRASYQASPTVPLQPRALRGLLHSPPMHWRREVVAPDSPSAGEAAPLNATPTDTVEPVITPTETPAAPSPTQTETPVEPTPSPTTTVDSLDAALPSPTSSDTSVVNWSPAAEGTSAWMVGYNAANIAVTTSPLPPVDDPTDASPTSPIVKAGVADFEVNGAKREADAKDTVIVSTKTIIDTKGTPVSYIGYNAKSEPVITAPLPTAGPNNPDATLALESAEIEPLNKIKFLTTEQGTPPTPVVLVVSDGQTISTITQVQETAKATDTVVVEFKTSTEGNPPTTIVYGVNAASQTVTTSQAQEAAKPTDTVVVEFKTSTEGNPPATIVYGVNAASQTVTTSQAQEAAKPTDTVVVEFKTSTEGNPPTTIVYGVNAASQTVTTSQAQEAASPTDNRAVSFTTIVEGDRTLVYGLNAASSTVTTSTQAQDAAQPTPTKDVEGNASGPSGGPADGNGPLGAVSTQHTITFDGQPVAVVQFNQEGSPTNTIPLSPTNDAPEDTQVVASSTITRDGNVVLVIGYGSSMDPLTTSTLKSAEEPIATPPVIVPVESAGAEGGSPIDPIVTRTEPNVVDGRIKVFEVDANGSTVSISTQTPTLTDPKQGDERPDNPKPTDVNPPVNVKQQANDNDGSPTNANSPTIPKEQPSDNNGSPTETPTSPLDVTSPAVPAEPKPDTAKDTTSESPKNTVPEPTKTSRTSDPYAWVPTSTLLQNPSATGTTTSEQSASNEAQPSNPAGANAKLAEGPEASQESKALASQTADAKAALPSEWPSSIVPQQDADDLEDGEESGAVGLIGAKSAKRPADTSVVSILFTKALSWSWLLSQGDASGQVFAYMPVLIAGALGLDPSEIVTISLEAWKPAKWSGDGADVRSVWVGHMPSKKVDFLAALMANTSSELYTSKKPITKQLSTCIDPSLPLLTLQNSLGIDPSGSSTAEEPDENAGKMSNKTTAFVASAAALGAIVLAVGAFFGSRYAIKKRKIAAEDSLHGSRYSGSDSSFASPSQHRNLPAFSSAAAAPMDNDLRAARMDEEDYARDSEYYGTQSDYPVTERDSMRDTYASLPPTGPLPAPPEVHRQDRNCETIAPLARNGASSYYPTERSFRTTVRSGSGSSVQSEILGMRQASMDVPIRDTWWKHASQWNDAGPQDEGARGYSVMSDPAPKSGRIVTLERPFSASTYSTLRTADGGSFNSANPFSHTTPFGQRLPGTKPSKISAPYLQDNSLML